MMIKFIFIKIIRTNIHVIRFKILQHIFLPSGMFQKKYFPLFSYNVWFINVNNESWSQ
jgi:hypothetical protein